MPLTGMSEDVRRFIVEMIDSVPELEALLLLRASRHDHWSVEDAGARLYVSVIVAAHVLNSLAERGLLAVAGAQYRYAQLRPELDAVVGDLASTYASNLIAVTRLIHNKPVTSVQQFADAFRLRKDT
jgi:hypothetical protein